MAANRYCYSKIRTGSATLHMMLQNLEEIVWHFFVTDKFIKWIPFKPPLNKILLPLFQCCSCE